jgi:PadR family transcriptional regulator AphA
MSYKYLILGLLMERPMSGYDIKKEVKRTLGAITSASYGTLYPTLHKLLAEGCVEMQEIPQRSRPSKKLYSLTPQGQDELTTWLRQPAIGDQIRREFLLKLYLAKTLGEQELRTIVTNRRLETELLLHSLQQDMQNAKNPQQQWVVDYALAMCEAEMNWLKQFESQFDVA